MKQAFNDHTICVWPSTLVKGTDSSIEDFEQWLMTEFGVKGKYLEEFKTLPDVENDKPIPKTGKRNDLIFMIGNEYIAKFAIPRLGYGISWWEDYAINNHSIIPQSIFDNYPHVELFDNSDYEDEEDNY